MKLDPELVRAILTKVEQLPYDGGFHSIAIESYSENDITYHVMLLHEAGLIQAQDLTTHDGIAWKPKRLTYSLSHERYVYRRLTGPRNAAGSSCDSAYMTGEKGVGSDAKLHTRQAGRYPPPSGPRRSEAKNEQGGGSVNALT